MTMMMMMMMIVMVVVMIMINIILYIASSFIQASFYHYISILNKRDST